jgi:hypothetical protein
MNDQPINHGFLTGWQHIDKLTATGKTTGLDIKNNG